MLSNAYFLAKFRSDTAENEPPKIFPNFAKFANFGIMTVDRLRPIRRYQTTEPGVANFTKIVPFSEKIEL